MSFFNKINDVLTVDTFKQISQRRGVDIEVDYLRRMLSKMGHFNRMVLGNFIK